MAKKVKKTAYQLAADELNDVMGLNPAIDSSLEDSKLKPYLVKAIEKIEDDDEFTEETQAVIDELTAEIEKASKKGGKKEAEAPAKGKGKKQPEPEPEEDDDDDDDDDDDEDDDDDDDDDEDEEEQPEPVKPAKGKKEAPAAKSEKKSEKKSDSDEPKKRGFQKSEGKSRITCICDAVKALPKKGMDMKKLAEDADKRYQKESKSAENLKQSLHTFKVILPVLVEFGIITVDGENIIPGK